MAWRNRVKSNLASGAYKQEDEGALTSAIKGFAEVYVPLKAQEHKTSVALQADALKKAKEKGAEEATWKEAAELLAAEIFPEQPDSKAAITYAYSTIASYQGNVGSATERLEKLRDDERLEIIGPFSMGSTTKVASLMGSFESGSGGYNALLNQSQDGQFSDTNLTSMNMQEVLTFSAPGSEYFNWSKNNMPAGTKAAASGEASTPMGKYQFVGSTIQDIKDRGGFDALGITDETVFNEETQDSLFTWYANDRLSAAGDSASAKRDALRSVWEGFNTDNVSDSELDGVIAEIETGTFSTGSVKTTKKMKRFDLAEKLEGLTMDQDGLDKLDLIQAGALAGDFDITESEKLISDQLYQQIQAKIQDGKMFNFGTFVEENRLNSAGDAMGAMTVVANMGEELFRGGEREKNEVYLELKNRLDMFNNEDRSKMLQKAAANRDPMVFYAKKDDGTLNLSPISVMVQQDGTLKQVGTDTIIDMSSGKLVPPELDASEFIKIYNKPISTASSIVENGVSGITNLLEYRKLTMDNPQAYNKYLSWVQGVGDQVENLGSTFNTLVAGGATYEQVELELFSQLRNLTGPAKEIFARQLQSAYDLARLNESKGQGLSDRELAQNLESVGFGEDRAENALRKINIAVDRYVLGVESRRAGIVNGLLGDSDYTGSIATTNFGIKFNDLITRELKDNEVLNNQLNLARSRDVSMSAQAPQTEKPSIEKFATDIRAANPNLEITDAVIQEMYNDTFPTTEQ
tara:strand:+ start:441 stop:2681 length:2241 start_codon:yes stop_codon:yes gene_type:complete